MASQEDRSVPGLVIVPLEGDPDGAVLGAWSFNRVPAWVPFFRDPGERVPGRDNIVTCAEYRGVVHKLLVEVPTGGQWLYKFAPLPDSERSTGLIHLDAKWLAGEAARVRRQRSYAAGAGASRYYAWAFGWLPARAQEHLAARHGFDAGGASAVNGLIEFFLGLVLCAVSAVSMFAGGFSGGAASFLPMWMIPIFMLMVVEGFARWVYCRSSEEGMGLYVIEGLDWVWVRMFG